MLYTEESRFEERDCGEGCLIEGIVHVDGDWHGASDSENFRLNIQRRIENDLVDRPVLDCTCDFARQLEMLDVSSGARLRA